jgi:hypothetical protein
VLLLFLAWILYGETNFPPPYVLGLVARIASGARMLAYTVRKPTRRPMSGTTTGVVNFLNFTCGALLGPVFGWLLATAGGGAATFSMEHYQGTFQPMLYGVALAFGLTLMLKETGPAVRAQVAAPRSEAT